MAVYPGFIAENVDDGVRYNGASTNLAAPARWDHVEPRDGEFLETLGDPDFGSATDETATAARAFTFSGFLSEEPHSEFFESIIVIPRSVALGFLLADSVFVLDIYNAYRFEPRTLTSLVNNSDPSIVWQNDPGLPYDFPAQWGLLGEFFIAGAGAPSVGGTLDFVWDTETILVAVSATRAIVMPFEPEAPLTEHLLFNTDVLRKRDGREQRISLRKIPRQAFEMDFVLDGFERERFEALFFDSGARAIGLPVWFEPLILIEDLPAGSLVATVETTDFADLRGTCLLYRASDYYESVSLSEFDATTLTFQTATQNDFLKGDRLYPMRVAYPGEVIRGEKIGPHVQRNRVLFAVRDNDSDLADAGAWSTFNDKVLFNDPNALEGDSLAETLSRPQVTLDPGTGLFLITSNEDQGRRGHSKGWVTFDRESLWDVRQVVHFLKGRLTSFYIPTFFTELRPTETVSSAGTELTIRNVGYTKFYQSRSPRNVVRIQKTDGTYLTSVVQSSVEDDEETETLTVDPPWTDSATVSEIVRVDLLTKVRMDSDDVVFTHTTAVGNCRIHVPVVEVFE